MERLTMSTTDTTNAKSSNLNDLTDFESGMNGWTLPDHANPSIIVDLPHDGKKALFGNSTTAFNGAVLTKRLDNLVIGRIYRVSYKGKKSANIPGLPQNIPCLQVTAASAVVIQPVPFQHHHWITYEGTFIATSNTVTIEFVSVVESDTFRGYGNYHLDDIRVSSYFDDLTDFDDSTTGQWRTTDASATARFVNGGGDHGKVFQLPTYGQDGNHGDVLIRTLWGLTPGTTYAFSVEARRDIGRYEAPSLSLVMNGVELSGRFSPELNTWNVYVRTFVATREQESLAIRSHVATGMGNDYSLDNVRILEMP
jgi:hypothetical protein